MPKKLQRLNAIRYILLKKRLKRLIRPVSMIIIPTLILSSCIWVFGHMGDPMQNLTFVNKTKQPITVKIQPINTDTNFSLTNRTNAHNSSFTQADRGQDANTIYLPKFMDEQGYMFGMGYWNEGEIGTISQNMGKLTFIMADKTVIYDKPEQIEKLLQENWEKSGKENTIEIEVK